MACLLAVRGLPGGRCSDRGRATVVSGRAHPVRGDGAQPWRARVVRSPLSLQAGRLGPGGDSWGGAGRDRCLHVRKPRGDRADRATGRALSDGLRGRGLVSARVGGGDACHVLPRGLPLPLRVSDARHRRRRARARVAARLLGALGRVLRRTRRAGRQWQAQGRVRNRGDRRRRWASRHIRAPQPPGRARTRGRAVHARRRAGLVRSACAGAQLRALRRTCRGARPGGRDQGRHLVEHGDAGLVCKRSARYSRVLCAGHRDELLPRRRGREARGARFLPARVSLHDDLWLEPRAAARVWAQSRADPTWDRPRHLPPAPGDRASRGHGAGAWAYQSLEEPAADGRCVASAARAAPGAVHVRDRAGAGHR